MQVYIPVYTACSVGISAAYNTASFLSIVWLSLGLLAHSLESLHACLSTSLYSMLRSVGTSPAYNTASFLSIVLALLRSTFLFFKVSLCRPPYLSILLVL